MGVNYSYNRSFFYNLKKILEDNRKGYYDDDLYYLCIQVRNCVLSGDLTNHKNASKLLPYWDKPDCDVEKATGINSNTVRSARKKMSKQLYEKFGYDFFQVITLGGKEGLIEGAYRLDLVKRNVSCWSFFSRDLIEKLVGNDKSDKGESLSYDLENCAVEIQFLLKYSNSRIDKELSVLDGKKLAYLLQVLDGTAGNTSDRVSLARSLEDN